MYWVTSIFSKIYTYFQPWISGVLAFLHFYIIRHSTISGEEYSVVQIVEISSEKSLYINFILKSDQQQKLIKMIQGKSGAFAWD